MSTKSDPPDVTIWDLNQIYKGAAKEILACDGNDLLVFGKNFKALLIYVTNQNLKTSLNAVHFILKLLNSTKPGSDHCIQIFNSLINICESSSHSGPIWDRILTSLSQRFIEATQNEALPDFSAITERLEEVTMHLDPNSGFHFLNHFQSLDSKVLMDLYGKLYLKILFEEIKFTKSRCLEFWNILSKDETSIFTLSLWIKEDNFPVLIHVFSLFPEKEIFKNFSVLCLANLFVKLSLSGIDNQVVFQKLLSKVVKADDLVQSIVCTLLALNLKDCPSSLCTKYLHLCTTIIKHNGVFKQVAQLLRVQLIFFCRDNIYFHSKCSFDLLKDAIEQHLENLIDISNPVLSDLCLQFIIKRYSALNKAFEILRLLNTFHSNPRCIPLWTERYSTVGFMIPKLDKDSDNDYFFSHKIVKKPRKREEDIFTKTNDEIYLAVLNLIMFYNESHSDLALNVILKTDKKDLCAAWLRFFVEDKPLLQNNLLMKIGSTKDHKGGDDFRIKLFEDIKANSLNNEVGVVENIYLKLKNLDDINIDEIDKAIVDVDSKEYVVGYLMTMNKAMLLNFKFDCQKFLIILNALLNKWINRPSASYVISVIIDCLKTFCSIESMTLIPICGEIIRIAININEDCVFKSLCCFLSQVPNIVYLQLFRIQDYALISKSVYVLWKLIVCDTSVSKHAVESLCYYNLEYFDCALLSCCDNVVDPSSENYKMVNGVISECCWLHLLLEIRKEYCLKLFTKLIEKGTANTPQHENYSCLHRALVMYLTEAMEDNFEYFDPENEPLTDICLNLLSIKWERSNLDFSFMYSFFLKSENHIPFQTKVLLILILNADSYSAKETFNKLIDNNLVKPHHTKMLYLLEGKQKKDTWLNIFKYTSSLVMKNCISQGLLEAFKDGHTIEDTKIMFVLRNPQVSFCVKHSIICSLLKIWEKCNKGEHFDLACSVLARCDVGFIHSLPLDKMDSKTNKKYIELLTFKAIHSKLLSDFAECFKIAVRNPSLKCFVLLNLIEILNHLHTVNLKENQVWLKQFIFKIEYKLDSFYASIIVLCFDVLAGSMLLSSELNLNSAVDHFPISFSTFFKGKEPSVIKMVRKWMDNQQLKPIFREAFQATIVNLCDAIPSVQYSSYVDISQHWGRQV